MLERVQRHDDEIDRGDPVLLEGGEVFGDVAAGEDAAVDSRVERLDPTIEHLRESRDFRHIENADPSLAEELRGPPGRDDLDPE